VTTPPESDAAAEARKNPGTWITAKSWTTPTAEDKSSARELAAGTRRSGEAFETMARLHHDGTLGVHVRYPPA
jgi:hypothetical protein